MGVGGTVPSRKHPSVGGSRWVRGGRSRRLGRGRRRRPRRGGGGAAWPPRTTERRRRRHVRRQPDVLGGEPRPQCVVRIGDDDHPIEPASVEQVGGVPAIDSYVVRPLVSITIASAGTPRSTRYCADDSASVNRSLGCLPPVTTTSGATPCVVQRDDVVEARGELRRRSPVVLGSAKHDDGVDRTGIAAWSLRPVGTPGSG